MEFKWNSELEFSGIHRIEFHCEIETISKFSLSELEADAECRHQRQHRMHGFSSDSQCEFASIDALISEKSFSHLKSW